MKVVIVKYNAGNIQSVCFACERLGVIPIVSDDVNEITNADKIIFPGVGEASTAINYLKAKKLDKVIPDLKQPVLGICLGMQLMCNYSEEGNTQCLGVFDVNVKQFKNQNLKSPQIGWNKIYGLKTPLFQNVEENEYMYFVHSYFVELCENTIATTCYGLEYSSALQKKNFYATQFHPEKSSDKGQLILNNFLKL